MTDILIQVGDCVALKEVNDSRGIVKYCGEVAGTSGGNWIGVDWDNATRGKHDGGLKGVRYFEARTNTSGSFVRPSALVTGVELIAEIKSKYADPLATTNNPTEDRWEFIELDKVYEKQNNTRMENYLPSMKLSSYSFPLLTEISLNNSFLLNEMANEITNIFCSIEEIYLAYNNLTFYAPTKNFDRIRRVDLQGNCIAEFSNISVLQSFPSLTFLNLSMCDLRRIEFGKEPGFSELHTLLLQENPISEWESIENLSRLPALKKLMIKDSNLVGSNGLDVRELIIAKIPNLIELDRCDISEVDRRSIEHFVLNSLTKGLINPVHSGTIDRLEKIYGAINKNNLPKKVQNENVNSRRLNLEYNEKKIQRNLSLLLSIHRIVGMASKILDFDPDEIVAVELRRTIVSPERLKRTKDSLLSQLNLEDDDTIAFLLN